MLETIAQCFYFHQPNVQETLQENEDFVIILSFHCLNQAATSVAIHSSVCQNMKCALEIKQCLAALLIKHLLLLFFKTSLIFRSRQGRAEVLALIWTLQHDLWQFSSFTLQLLSFIQPPTPRCRNHEASAARELDKRQKMKSYFCPCVTLSWSVWAPGDWLCHLRLHEQHWLQMSLMVNSSGVLSSLSQLTSSGHSLPGQNQINGKYGTLFCNKGPRFHSEGHSQLSIRPPVL